MTNKPHHHADILRAIADGKEIQYRRTDLQSNEWDDTEPSHFFRVAAHDYITEFRIKPEVKTVKIILYKNGAQARTFNDDHEMMIYLAGLNTRDNIEAIIKISYTPGEGLES